MNIVFLVHGTWGQEHSAWYQPNSKSDGFTTTLKKHLGECGVQGEVDFVPFEWSGENSHAARVDGAKRLCAKLLEISERCSEATFHFVAHSHGGNVVLKALEIYLNERPSELCTRVIDNRDPIDHATQFLKDYNEGKLRFNTSPKEVQRLISALTDALKARESKSITRTLTDGTIYDIELGWVKDILARLYRHVFALEQFHQIGSVVTLGTPFYEKRWKITKIERLTHILFHWLSFLPLAVFVSYFYIILGYGLLALLPWFSWTGFNPLEWNNFHQVPAVVLLILSSLYMAASASMEQPVDTNVYFDEATAPYYLEILGESKICKVLNVHSSYLDEAYWLLATYPLLANKALELFQQAFRPKAWAYQKPPAEIGFWPQSPPAAMGRRIRRLQRFVLACLFLVLFPFRLIFFFIGSVFFSRLLHAQIRSVSCGLPAEEFSGGSEISIHSTLSKPFFDVERLDVTKVLATRDATGGSDQHFRFLWDDSDFGARVSQSMILNKFKIPESTDSGRQLLVLEERLKEYYGLVGVKHSMYYSNDSVIASVAKFLASCMNATSDTDRPSTHITKIPRRPFEKAAS